MKKIFITLILLALTLNVKVANAETLNCNKYLRYGSTGSQVKILQEELNQTMNCNLNIDGIIGPKTNQCILQFQTKNNLEVDGIVGPITCKKLNQDYATELKKNYVIVTGIKGKEVYVRTYPNLEPESIKGTVKQGEILQVYATRTTDGITWHRVYTQQYGFVYIHGSYVQRSAIVIDIENQQLTYFKNAKKIMSVPVITGLKNVSDTPKGKYLLNTTNKRRNQVLKGQNYEKNVSYWMPFITERGIGLHDASWWVMDDFTKTKYIENGSHGCVNMRPNDAKKLYENLTTDTYVIVK